nr:MAG TPA: hypothetical protein [Caudoviricetes sp.]
MIHMNNDLLKEDFNYYVQNHKEIVKKYLNKYIVIKEQSIVDSYDTFEEAVSESSKKYDLGTFIIQKCSEDLNELTQVFHSRVL